MAEINSLENEIKELAKQRMELESTFKRTGRKPDFNRDRDGKDSRGQRDSTLNKRTRDDHRDSRHGRDENSTTERNLAPSHSTDDQSSKRIRLSRSTDKPETTPFTINTEKPKPTLDTSADKSRNRKLFGVLLGTLSTFKTSATRKSEADKKKRRD